MESALMIANYFLKLADDDSGELLSNMKLQKLLYYAQGFHLALYNEPLFKERILAWTHGPVVADVYYKYKEYGNTGIPTPSEIDCSHLPLTVKELLNEIFNVFGQFSAWKLRDLTHEEPPWKETSNGEEIAYSKLKDYFLTQIQNA